MKNFRFKKFVSIVTSFAMIASAFIYFPFYAKAATVTSFSDTVTRLGTAELANHTILFTSPTGVASGAVIVLTFDNSTSIPGAWDFTDADVSFQASPDGVCETGDTEVVLAAAPAGAGTGGIVDTSSTVITYTHGTTAIAAGSEICFEIGTNADSVATGDQQITNGSAGNTTLVISGNFGDSGTVTMPILAADLDQVLVTATVAPSLTFALSANTVALGALTSASTGTGTHTITTGTNATGGLVVTYNAPTTLTSGGDTITQIGGTPAASDDGTEQFGINLMNNATPNIGSDPTVCTPTGDYDTADEFAFESGSTIPLANSAGAPASCVLTVSYIANITSSTEAGSYATTLTYIATGTF